MAFLATGMLLAACQPATATRTAIDDKFTVSAGQTLSIQLESGSVSIVGAEGPQLVLGGEVAEANAAYAVKQTSAGIEVVVDDRRTGLGQTDFTVDLLVEIPDGLSLQVDTFSAEVSLAGYAGNAEVVSVAGDIRAEDLSGTLVLRSGRGNITLHEVTGEIHVLGEHGLLTLESVSGEVDASTIMGSIQFEGEPGEGDSIRLEADHGAIAIGLGPASDLSIEVNTASGATSCLGSGVSQTSRTCAGSVGSGAGALRVRTVSGAVNLRVRSE